jgi:hypothetical protein
MTLELATETAMFVRSSAFTRTSLKEQEMSKKYTFYQDNSGIHFGAKTKKQRRQLEVEGFRLLTPEDAAEQSALEARVPVINLSIALSLMGEQTLAKIVEGMWDGLHSIVGHFGFGDLVEPTVKGEDSAIASNEREPAKVTLEQVQKLEYDWCIQLKPVHAQITGDTRAALYLAYILRVTAFTEDPDGWWSPNQETIQRVTALSAADQEHARKVLQGLGFWEEEIDDEQDLLWCRVDLDAYAAAVKTSNEESSKRAMKEFHEQEAMEQEKTITNLAHHSYSSGSYLN